MDSNLQWLKYRVEHYQANKTHACETIDDFDELHKLGKGFSSGDSLQKGGYWGWDGPSHDRHS